MLEIATTPHPDTREAGEELRELRREVAEAAARRGLLIGSAGTHPFAMWEDQRVSSRPALPRADRRAALRRAPGDHLRAARPRRARRRRQGDPRRQRDARARADPVRAGRQLAVLARRRLPASPPRGCRSSAPSRASASRRSTRAGTTSSAGSSFMVDAGVIDDYTCLWYDVRPHPNFGTVEIRAMDAQTHVEHTLALAALIQAMVKELSEHYDAGKQLARLPVRDARREQVARRPPRAGGRARRPPERATACPPRSSRGASTTGCASTRRTSDRPTELEGDRGPARERERRRSPARGVRGEPRLSASSCRRSSELAHE